MMVRPTPVVRRRRRFRVLVACSGAGKPQCSKVAAICRSSCVRSVTMRTVAPASFGSRRTFTAIHSIVSDFPEPWVVPHHAAALLWLDSREYALLRFAHTARYCW